MGTFVREITHNFTGETGYVIIVPKKTTAPLADVVCTIDGVPLQTRKVYPFPHAQESLLVEGLDPVMYYFKCYRSADGVALDEQINILAVNAKTGATQVLTKYEYVVNRGESEVDVWADPVTDDTGVGDTRLKDATYWIEERGTGSLLAVEITNRALGGFDFSDPGKVMNDGGVYFAWVATDWTASGGGDTMSAAAMDILMVDADFTYDPVTHMNKVIKANFAGTVGTITLPLLSTLPDGSFKLDTNNGLQRNFVLQLGIGDGTLFLGELLNKVVLGKGESVTCTIKGNALYLYDYTGDARARGTRKYADIVLINTWPLCGTGPHNLTDFPSVAQLINKLDPLSIITSFAAWGNTILDGGPTFNAVTKYPNKGKWCVPGDGTFYFPDARNQFQRAINFEYDGSNLEVTADLDRSSQGAGGFQKQALDSHWHNAGTETTALSAYRRGLTHAAQAWSASSGPTSANPASTDTNINGIAGNTRPDNHGSLPLICI